MNILFLNKSLDVGGVEIVSAALANKFVQEGHGASIFAFYDTHSSIEDRLDSRVHTYVQKELKCNKENKEAMRNVLVKDKIDIVINQWGLPFTLLKTAKKAAVGMNVKFISVYHNTPDMNGRLQTVDRQILANKNPASRLILKAKRWAFKEITAAGMRYNYRNSDIYEVLSPSFVEKFKEFTGIKNPKKLIVQGNPLTIDNYDYKYLPQNKRKEIIYVGRIENEQKRVDRLLETWALIYNKFPDWKLTVVGDGMHMSETKALAQDLGLKQITFEGFKKPNAYYERASILAMTSEFEGFPLVLPECMSYGVVPVVYGSYSEAYDIVDRGKTGLIVDKVDGHFSPNAMAGALISLMGNEPVRIEMAKNVVERSKMYSIDAIYGEWMNNFKLLYHKD